ncbi:MAG: hypothetical protein HUJ78_05010 [Mogibacterium sp.]|nr:hypothetical protein [Mogibacterium sp.]
MKINLNDKSHKISPELADQMLQNIFEACEVQPNSVALEDIESYSNYRKDKFKLRKVLVTVILLLFLVLPVLFISPQIVKITQAPTAKPTYNMTVSAILPVSSVTATIDGTNVPVYQKEKGVYTLQPDREGTMLITVRLINKQYAQKKIKVTNVDTKAPYVVRNYKSGNKFFLYLKDDSSGVDYESIYCMDASENKTTPISYNEETGEVVFSFPANSVNIFISDKAGNQLHLLLTI